MATNTVLRSLHDLGLASWFGGSLMGITGLRAAAFSGSDSLSRQTDREADGWDAWTPVAAASIAAHAVGGIGMIVVNRDRHARQDAVMTTTAIKAGVTGMALGTTLAQGIVGGRLRQAQRAADEGDVEQKDRAERLRRQVRVLDAATPLLTGILLVLAAREGELQRPAAVAGGTVHKLAAAVGEKAGAAKDLVVERLTDESVGERISDLTDAVRDRISDAHLGDTLEAVKGVVKDHTPVLAA